jgi:hypothetical protein
MKSDERGYPSGSLKAKSTDPDVEAWYYVSELYVDVCVRHRARMGTEIVMLPTRRLRAILERTKRTRRVKR